MYGSAAVRCLVALALAGVAPAGAQSAQEPTSDSVALRFAWPIGVEGRITYIQIMEREGESDQPTRLEIEGEYTLHVHEHPQGLVIEHLEPLVTRFQSSPPLSADDPRGLIYSIMGPPTPYYVVSREGVLLGVDGIEALTTSVADILQARLGPSSDGGAVMNTLLNPNQMVGVARERWNDLVGMWRDVSLRVGEPGTIESEDVNPLIPSVVVPYMTELTLVGMEPCDGAPETGRPVCAHLEMVAVPNPVEMNRVISNALADMGFPNLSFEGLAELSRVTLLTEPATLLPRELTISKLVEGILNDGGQRRVFRRFDQTRLVYTYGR